MSKGKKLVIALAVAVMLVSGVVTVAAVAEGGGEKPAVREAPADYEAEEMAIGAYYAGLDLAA